MQKVFFIFLTALLLGSTASFASYTASNDDGAEHRSARQGVAETALMGNVGGLNTRCASAGRKRIGVNNKAV